MVDTHPESDTPLKQSSPWLAPERIIPAGFAALIVILLSMATVAYFSTVKLTADALSVQRANRVQAGLAVLQIAVNEAEIGQGRFTITGNDYFLEPFRLAAERVAAQAQSLRSLVDASQREHLESLLRLIAQRIELAQTIIDLRRNDGFDAARARIASGETRELQNRIRSAIGAMLEAQENVVRQRENDTLNTARSTLALLAAAVVFALVAVSTGLYFVQRSLKERSRAEVKLRQSLRETVAAKNRGDAFIARIDAALSNDAVDNTTRSPVRPDDAVGRDYSEALVHKLEEKGLLLTQANQDLAAGEQRLQMALAAARMGTWDWNLVTGQIMWSRGHEELWGLMPGSFQGTYAAFDTQVHPDDRAGLAKSVQFALDTRSEYNREFRVIHPDGSVHWIAGRGHAIYDETGQPQRMTGIVIDISDRHAAEEARELSQAQLRDSEARLRGILDSLFAFVGLFSIDGILLEANRAPLAAAGLNKEDVVGKPIIDTYWLNHSPHTQAQMTAAIARAAQGETVRADLDIRVADGSLIILDTVVGPLYAADGRVVQVVASGVDVTARKQAEAQRQKLEAQLWQAQKMEALGTLAGGVAHDFNNILSAIAGNAELARQDVGATHPAMVSLNEIRKASQRAKFLVQQILAFSRQQASERRPIALKSVVTECAAMLRATLPATVELHVACHDDVPNVLADATQIHQVLLNLGTNAWHALGGQPGRIDIAVELSVVETDLAQQYANLHAGRYACLSVSDTGTGMDEATLGRIFEPFFTTKIVGQGTGLGLSVVDGIVKGHDGAIKVSSVVGKGSTFMLYFPAANEPATQTQPAPQAALRGQGQCILYLDDDEALVTLTIKTLERGGYRAAGFTHATLALDAVRADLNRFDLVVTDFTMPGTSGIQVARQLQQLCPSLPVVLTSGYVTDDLKQRAAEVGIRHVLHKPHSSSELCEVIQRVLEAKRLP